ncbi:hypothetical protein VB715_08010 [Crocosphaera sp. UHCC 0190]|uniref:hypothetical protein n=1 Tax=Crocosphaera sp. UHCC 0190 TaxID=3110246 RepID=UPI002B1FD346|nr:hypothetical protein [Crocosphaera sp. UHCC 0190]MEA5509706.1 hypothetical protein [Crocosphaera sp. UHCC 0190]
MINLRKAIYYEYVDNITVEIFDKYKWGLRRLGVNFSQELLETIVYCPQNLESTLMAFCAWVLWLKAKGEKTDAHNLSETLINALRSEQGWKPFEFQAAFLAEHHDILASPKDAIWEVAGQQLGETVRNRLIADISEEGEILFQTNLMLNEKEKQQIDELKTYIADLYL